MRSLFSLYISSQFSISHCFSLFAPFSVSSSVHCPYSIVLSFILLESRVRDKSFSISPVLSRASLLAFSSPSFSYYANLARVPFPLHCIQFPARSSLETRFPTLPFPFNVARFIVIIIHVNFVCHFCCKNTSRKLLITYQESRDHTRKQRSNRGLPRVSFHLIHGNNAISASAD